MLKGQGVFKLRVGLKHVNLWVVNHPQTWISVGRLVIFME